MEYEYEAPSNLGNTKPPFHLILREYSFLYHGTGPVAAVELFMRFDFPIKSRPTMISRSSILHSRDFVNCLACI